MHILTIVLLCVGISVEASKTFSKPLVIAHRGASGYRPEHTLASYELAMDLHCDYVELDLEMTKDHKLIALHENELSIMTNIADHPEFASKLSTKRNATGYFTEDFTLEELRTLRTKERFPFRSNSRDGLYQIPTLKEAIQLIRSKEKETGRMFGLYVETKWSTFFAQLGFPMEEILVEELRANEIDESSVIIESFDSSSLLKLHKISNYTLVQLISDQNGSGLDFTGMTSPEGLLNISTYADGIGPKKSLIYETTSDRSQPNLIELAHKFGLFTHTWTLRKDEYNLGSISEFSCFEEELEFLFELGVDGVFTDFPDLVSEFKTTYQGKDIVEANEEHQEAGTSVLLVTLIASIVIVLVSVVLVAIIIQTGKSTAVR